MIWKPIPGFLDYEVSERGDVRRGPQQLTPERTAGNGRKRFTLSKGGRSYKRKAHQLVALAFLGPPPFEGAEVCHRDGFQHNNHWSNLRWGTQRSNSDDAHLHHMRRKIGRAAVPRTKDLISLRAAEFLAGKE